MATGNLKKLHKLAAALGISSLIVLGAAACDRTEDTEDPADQQEQEAPADQEQEAPAPGVDDGDTDEGPDDGDMGDHGMDHGDTDNNQGEPVPAIDG
jgi:hypothetical protein